MERLDAQAVRAWARAASRLLAASAPQIDAVNVFPVPDADTGTNVRLTIAGGARAVERAPGDAGPARLARAFAAGTLTEARGNSGVILSQYLAALAESLSEGSGGTDPRVEGPAGPGGTDPGVEGPDARALAAALDAAATAARGAVADPQEGTVLTVARLVGERARHAARQGADVSALLGPVLDETRHELTRISAEHPVLRYAQVVDAGACALLVVLEALDRALAGRADGPDADDVPGWLPTRGADPGALSDWLAAEGGGTFEVMALVRPAAPDDTTGDRLRERLSAVGDSVAVVGADDLWHVHVHTDDPAAAIEAAHLGERSQVVVRLVEGAAAQVVSADDLGLVVATTAPGTAHWFATGGAVVVVRCPEAPATAAHLARAVADSGADRVLVLPGSPELLDEARALTTGPEALPGVGVDVVATTDTLACAVAALAVFGGSGGTGPAARAHSAAEAVGRLRTTDVRRAGADLPRAVRRAVRHCAPAQPQALTLQHRDPLDARRADELRDALAEATPDLDVVLLGPVADGPAWRIGLD